MPPVLASIGTVLIDAFDTLPRPVVDDVSPEYSSPTSPGVPQPPISNIPPPLFIPPSHLRLSPSLSSPSASAPSGPSTPQLSLDDIPVPNAEEVYEMLGGGGLFALVGARIWLPPSRLRALANRAPPEEDDCPKDVEDRLNKLGEEMWVWNRGPGVKMTRARIRYEGNVRYFQPIVKAPHWSLTEMCASPLRDSEYLHISPPYSPKDVFDLIEEQKASKGQTWDPKIVFEPTPPSCHAGQREWLEKILPHIHVLSPNHEELFSFYDIPTMSVQSPSLRPTVERLVTFLIHDIGIGADGEGIIVIRCGSLGSCVGTKQGGLKWCPAYWDRENSKRVKDVTGAGNSFLGGYVAGLHLSDNPYEAALYATVSSSYVVEQFGLPSLTGADAVTGEEGWNSDNPSRRLRHLKKRLLAICN
ncbi:pfkB family carbohydrate kinase superfamily protein [Cryptococcus wingfieldii CBS 7118]|uniref:PfkB family carbohydrate kinase superfamily protein n=1 Tax=Cryptococcus wingfieldii CBS 7118 TaxID=1295528 RepID=A0A1E3ITW9_9TREE|nr:pfkB family carbohydrate kinase superfamily protein [Cryptococcus wingfieldii CBS 7118]ODN92057.1 pfkB family carbohydrate kinase superfamily protein [Cryptococcus wingfieldii CBS 7118]